MQIKNKIASVLKRVSNRIRTYELVIQIESFTQNIDLTKILDKEISELKKSSKMYNIYLECNESQIEFEMDKKLSKFISVKEFKHTTLLNMTFVKSYISFKKFEKDKLMEKIKKTLEDKKIYAELGYNVKIVKNYKKEFQQLSVNLVNPQKSLKTRIKNYLWLEYGIDDKLPEKQIDKLVSSLEKAKVEFFWVKRDKSFYKLK